MELIVDVQGFKTTDNEFIVKEIAYISRYSDSLKKSYILKPPFPWTTLCARYRSVNLWTIRNYHGISWGSGTTPYNILQTEIDKDLSSADVVYVKGSEKVVWMKKRFPLIKKIIDLENLRCPSLQKLVDCNTDVEVCTGHGSVSNYNVNCSVRNIIVLKRWLADI